MGHSVALFPGGGEWESQVMCSGQVQRALIWTGVFGGLLFSLVSFLFLFAFSLNKVVLIQTVTSHTLWAAFASVNSGSFAKKALLVTVPRVSQLPTATRSF